MKMNSNRGSKQDEELYFEFDQMEWNGIHQNTAVSVVFNNAFHFSLYITHTYGLFLEQL